MISERLGEISDRYAALRIAVIGDFCLDRYLEIDPARGEISIETGLPVHNVVRVRPQPGGAGTIVNNLVALGVGEIVAVGFCGDDGEGYELLRALRALPGMNLSHFIQTPLRRTFTYCKPIVMEKGAPPRELSRLDSKNWTPTPPEIAETISRSFVSLCEECDAIIVLDQVDVAETGVVGEWLVDKVGGVQRIPIIADSRRGLRGFPPYIFKMNAAELTRLTGETAGDSITEIQRCAAKLARQNQQPVFVTLAERGIVGASTDGRSEHVAALPIRGPIDVVGAGDAVTANLAAALAAGATINEAMQCAALASSVVLHQVGTSGAATVEDILALLPVATF